MVLVSVTDIAFGLLIDGVDWTCDALIQWSVTYGRSDAVSVPNPARGRFTLMVNAGNRAQPVQPGSLLQFRATLSTGTFPLATMLVSKVTRKFEQPDSWNTIDIDAEGPATLLERYELDPDWRWDRGAAAGASRYEEADGVRVLAGLQLQRWPNYPPFYGATLAASNGRTAAGHTLADRFPANAAGWTDAGVYRLTSAAWKPVALSAAHTPWPNPPVAGRTYEVEYDFDVDAPTLVRTPDLVDRYYAAGNHVLTFAFSGTAMPTIYALALDPAKEVRWTQADQITNAPHHWTDVTPPTLQWRQVVGSSTSTLTLNRVDGWELGRWPVGQDMLTERADFVESETLAQHLASVTTACRSVLWENPDGTFSYQTRADRAAAVSQLDIDACNIVTPTTSTVDWATVRNHIVQEYGYKGQSDRDSYMVGDPPSQDRYGRNDRKNTGPILTRGSAQAIADAVLRQHRYANEVLPQVVTKRLEDLPIGVTNALVRLPLGSRLTIINAPPGWVSSPTWTGFVEGWTMRGTQQGTEMTLQLSPYVASVRGATALTAAKPAGVSAGRGHNDIAHIISTMHLPALPGGTP